MLQSYPTSYVVIDFETSGLTTNDKVTEIGLVKVINNEIVDKKAMLLYHKDLILSKKIIEITHITDELLKTEGINPNKAFEAALEFRGDLPWLGHNIIKFDLHFLNYWCEKNNRQDYIKENLKAVDTAAMYKAKRLNRCRQSSETILRYHGRILSTPIAGLGYKLQNVAREFQIPPETAHRALGDCLTTHGVYQHLLRDKKFFN